MTQGDEKKDRPSDRRRDILKEERTYERKTRHESEETDDKNQCYGVSCCMDSPTWATKKEYIKDWRP